MMLEKAIGLELQKTIMIFDEFVNQVERRYLSDDEIEVLQAQRMQKLMLLKDTIEDNIDLFGDDDNVRFALNNTVFKLENIRDNLTNNL